MDLSLVPAGLSAILSGLGVRWLSLPSALPDDFRERALIAALARPFDEAAAGNDVCVEGVVVDGPGLAPIAGVAAGWVRIEVLEETSTSEDDGFTTAFAVTGEESCTVLDEAGRRVLVRVQGHLGVDGLEQKSSGPVIRPSAAVAAWLAARGRPSPTEDDFVRRRVYREQALVDGQRVVVIGVKRGSGQATFRDAASDPFVEATYASVRWSRANIAHLGAPQPPSMGRYVGWASVVAGALTLALSVAGALPPQLDPDDPTHLALMVPIGVLVLWFGAGLVAFLRDILL